MLRLITIKAELSDEQLAEIVPSVAVEVEILSDHGFVLIRDAEIFNVKDIPTE